MLLIFGGILAVREAQGISQGELSCPSDSVAVFLSFAPKVFFQVGRLSQKANCPSNLCVVPTV